MSAKTEDVEAAIARLVPYGDQRGGQTQRDIYTLLASHAAQAEEIATQSRLITEQDEGLAKYEDALVSQPALVRSQAERIASLEEQLARVVPLLSDEDKMHPVGCSTWLLEASVASEEITDLLSGKASA
jgi:hypothetical protein